MSKKKDENVAKMMKKKDKEKNPKEDFPAIELTDLEDGFHIDIINMFELLSKPFKEGEGEKEAVMLDILKDHNAFYEEKIGIIVPALTEEPKRVVVSHIDLISPFNRGFAKGRVYTLGKKGDEDIIIGALDNTMTNAVVVLSLLELRAKGLAEDTLFLFTEGEEIDFLGMKAYLRKYSNKPLFINLDVTNDNCEFNTSVEFDNPNWSVCKQIDAQKELFTSGFTTDRVDDDTDAVLAAKGQGFSYCLPTWKTIHSYKNYTLVKNLVPYFEGLKFLIHGLEIDGEESYEQDFEYLSMKKALACETQKELDKAEKKAKKKELKRRKKFSSKYNYSSGYHGRRPSYPSTGWGNSGTHHVSDNDFDIYNNQGSIDEFGQGRMFYDYGNNIVSEEEMLKNMMNDFDSINHVDTSNCIYEEDMGHVNAQDIQELEEVINSAQIAAKDYEIKVDDTLKSFISENVMSRAQWTIDDLAEKLEDITKAQALIDAFDDYYVLDTIEPGVYQFKSSCPLHA